MKRNLFHILGIIMSCCLLLGCQEEPNGEDVSEAVIKSIELSERSIELHIGESKTLKATIRPDNVVDKTIIWSSTDTTIATVNDGVVMAATTGTATIIAKAGDKTASCDVTVVATPVNSITLNIISVSLKINETLTLKATVSPDDATDKVVIWTSSDSSIVTVDEVGFVKAMKVGTAIISATAGGKTATCSITVTTQPVEGLSLNRTSASLLMNETLTIIATVNPDDAADKTVTWSSSNPGVATVNNGVVKALKIGQARITAKAEGKTADCDISVIKLPTSGIIEFQDNMVKQACVAKYDTDKDGELSYEEASAVTDLNGLFYHYGPITSFDEFKYFTSVTKLPDNFFNGCRNLKYISIPSSVTTIGDDCFSGCESLSSIDIPSSVTKLGKECFCICKSLSGIYLPSSILEIGEYCFSACYSLSGIEIPSSVTKIPDFCFSACTSLSKVIIPSSVTEFGVGCFEWCPLSNFDIPSSVTKLGGYLFYGCGSLSSINIPSSVTKLGDACFYGCSSLTHINIPSSVTELGDECFMWCSSLAHLKIPSAVTKI